MKSSRGKAEKLNKGPISELVGEPESVDIDGAVMQCHAGKGTNNLTKKQPTNWFCAWADHSTIAVISPRLQHHGHHQERPQRT